MSVQGHIERRCVGGILSAGSYGVGRSPLRAALASGLTGRAFYLRSLGAIFDLLVDMDRRDLPLDPVSVAAEIVSGIEHRVGPLGELDERLVNGDLLVARVTELAHEPGAYFGTVDHLARLIVAHSSLQQTGQAA